MPTLVKNPVRVDAQSATLTTPPSADAPAWTRYFEELYHDAAGDVQRVPWADDQACPALCAWLNSEAPSLVRPGATACIVGCGLGEDAKELADRGYDIVAFDVSPTAVAWARTRHPDTAERFVIADLFHLPTSLQRRWDLVVEINTLQAIHPDLRPTAAAGIASLARPRGIVLTICRGRDEAEPLPDLPPYPLSTRELTDLFAAQGFLPTREADDFADDQGIRRLRTTFKRG